MNGWINPDKNVPGMKLDLGSGNPEEGEVQAGKDFVLQDISPHKGIDLVCDILFLYKYVKRESCSHIRMSHVLEHFGRKEAPLIVKMIHTLLQPGGTFEIYVPNFEWHMDLLSRGLHEDAVLYAFGGQLDPWDYHKTGFTPYLLIKLLEQEGFVIEKLDPDSSIGCIAKKS